MRTSTCGMRVAVQPEIPGTSLAAGIQGPEPSEEVLICSVLVLVATAGANHHEIDGD